MITNLAVQYYRNVTMNHIKKFGQIYTNSNVAKFMVDWLMSKNPSEIFDPAFGMGEFYYQSLKSKFKGKFKAKEIDVKSYNFFLKHSNTKQLSLLNEDYFNIWSNNYECIVCNPPYLKFQNIENRDYIFSCLKNYLGIKVSGYTNMASAFLLKSIYELNFNGCLAYIMPSEFLNSGYGKIVKQYLLDNGSIENIIQIQDEQGAFNSVITTVCIILFVKNKCNNTIKFSKITNVSKISVELVNEISIKNITANEKWQKYFEPLIDFRHTGFIPLSSYGKFKRGIATGANEFFILDANSVKKHNFDKSEVTLCVTRSNQIKHSIFNDNMLEKLIYDNENIYILDVSDKKELLSSFVQQYIQMGENAGYNQRYLTKTRPIWYALEKRNPSPILFGVFSRGEIKIIRNYTKAVNLTCYHGFEPKDFVTNDIIDKLFLYLKSNVAKESFNINKRVYGNNLTKFEPNDISKTLVPNIEQLSKISSEFTKEQIQYVLKYDKLSMECEELFYSL